jgi:hypothetical protein
MTWLVSVPRVSIGVGVRYGEQAPGRPQRLHPFGSRGDDPVTAPAAESTIYLGASD